MLTTDMFLPRLLLPSMELPATLMLLEEWVLVRVYGKDTIKYLQSQVTCDVLKLNINSFNFTAHCNTQGKILSCLYIFYYKDGIAYITRRNVINKQVAELKKYSIFSQVSITIEPKIVLLGFSGYLAPQILNDIFHKIPNIKQQLVHQQNTTLLYFDLPIPRYLLITETEQYSILLQKFKHQIKFNNSKQWVALDIEAGYPIIDLVNSEKFTPQTLNIQKLNGISFNKGCYRGQEIIARTQYRGKNKRTLYWLIGILNTTPKIGAMLEAKNNDDWYHVGIILTSCKLKNNHTWLQAILSKNLPLDTILRIYHEHDNFLSIKKLS